jgi:transaldolase
MTRTRCFIDTLIPNSGHQAIEEDIMLETLKVKLFVDGANLKDFEALASQPWLKGFTTNPSLMRKSGATHYKGFALNCLKVINQKPVSFEVFADDPQGMIDQGLEIASWGKNVYVKIPVTNTKSQSTGAVIKTLVDQGVKLNITAVFTPQQVRDICQSLNQETPSIISIFAGRIADTGRDPMPIMEEAKEMLQSHPQAELLWASTREALNITQANEIGCDIITVPADILGKLDLFGKDLNQYSLETVKTFYNDAQAAGFSL